MRTLKVHQQGHFSWPVKNGVLTLTTHSKATPICSLRSHRNSYISQLTRSLALYWCTAVYRMQSCWDWGRRSRSRGSKPMSWIPGSCPAAVDAEQHPGSELVLEGGGWVANEVRPNCWLRPSAIEERAGGGAKNKRSDHSHPAPR